MDGEQKEQPPKLQLSKNDENPDQKEDASSSSVSNESPAKDAKNIVPESGVVVGLVDDNVGGDIQDLE